MFPVPLVMKLNRVASQFFIVEKEELGFVFVQKQRVSNVCHLNAGKTEEN